MEYCAPQGIPHSVFLSWNQNDQDKAIAWVTDKFQRCKQCGSYPEDWLDDEGRDVFPPPMYARSLLCLGCATIAGKEEEIKQYGERPSGLHVYLSSEPPAVREDDDWDEEDDG